MIHNYIGYNTDIFLEPEIKFMNYINYIILSFLFIIFILLFNIQKKRFKEFILYTIRMQIFLNCKISIYTLIGILDFMFLLIL